jgi:predicted O-linked N-acetylglucosamine transferase (SPINDLY family)
MVKISVDKTLSKANSYVNKGDFEAAYQLYQKILTIFPNNKRAQKGFRDMRALQNPPQQIANQLIKIYNQGQFEMVATQALKILEQYPNSITICNILGAAYVQFGNSSKAINAFKKVVQLDPYDFETYNNMGITLYGQHKLEEAIDAFKHATSINKNYAEAYNNMGIALKDKGDLNEAVVSYKMALAARPNYVEAWNNMGIILHKQIKLEESINAYKKALAINPNYVEAWNNMGVVLHGQKKLDESLAAYKKALALNSSYADAHNNMGLIFKAQGKLDEALDSYKKALSFKPNYTDAYENISVVLEKQGQKDQVIENFVKLLTIKPNDESLRVRKLHEQSYICDWNGIREDSALIPKLGTTEQSISPFMILSLEDNPARHRLRSEINAKAQYTLKPLPIISKPSTKPKRLRIGYFSADLIEHPVAYLIAKVFQKHNRENFEIYGYSINSRKESHLRERLVKSFDIFKDVQDMSDKDVALLARQDQIDIAIDLTGYMFNSRPEIFAHRAAPIQISYLGYPGTMGADFIDYIIADEVLIPPDMQQNYSEKIIFLPNSYIATDNTLKIAKETPSRLELGLPEEGFVFCAINNSYKYSVTEFEIWMRLLKNVDKSILWLLESNKWAKENLISECVLHGVDPKRLVFANKVGHDKYLAQFRQADLFIDTFIYNAGATACNALWAGLPVVTKSGKGYTARMATSILTAIGLPELITNTNKEYEELILELALNPKRLSILQEKLAKNRLTKPLFDSELFTQHLEKGYQQAYKRFFDGMPNQEIYVEK